VALLDRRWRVSPPAVQDPDLALALRNTAEERLRRFGAERDLAATPVMVERHVEVTLPEGVRLFGRVDRVDQDPDGALHVIDYKGGARPDVVDATQIRLYAMLLERRLERPVRRGSYWFLDDGRSWTAELDPAGHEAAARDAVETAEAMRREAEYAPNVGPHCHGCAYRGVCPAWPAAQAGAG
jgi:putative RecB family exonuclease